MFLQDFTSSLRVGELELQQLSVFFFGRVKNTADQYLLDIQDQSVQLEKRLHRVTAFFRLKL